MSAKNTASKNHTKPLTQPINSRHRHRRPRKERERSGVVPVEDHVPVGLVRGCDRLEDLEDEEAVYCGGGLVGVRDGRGYGRRYGRGWTSTFEVTAHLGLELLECICLDVEVPIQIGTHLPLHLVEFPITIC